jgi:hypothetical protein
MVWICSVRWKSASKMSPGMGSPDAANDARLLRVKSDGCNAPTPDGCPRFYKPRTKEISTRTEGLKIRDPADRNLLPTGTGPAHFPQERQIGRCSDSRIKLQRHLQAQRAWPCHHNNPQALAKYELGPWDSLKTGKYSPRFHEAAQAFLFVTFSEQDSTHPESHTFRS